MAKQYRQYLTKVSFIALIALLAGCAGFRDSRVGKMYNDLTARYNGYFNAKELVKASALAVEEAHVDDYNEVLKVHRWGSEVTGKTQASDMDKAAEKCTKVIQKNEGSKWIDDAYFTVAQAYFYKADYYAALDLFKFLTNEYKGQEMESKARLWTVRCLIQMNKITDAQAYLTNIQNERRKFKEYEADVLLLNAHIKIEANNISDAIISLEKAIPQIKDRKNSFRYTFILAQLYELKGNRRRAGDLYKSIVNKNMPYEFQFQSRISVAKCSNLSSKSSTDKVVRSFKRLLRDDNNREYFDQIHYEIGNVYLRSGDKAKAIEHYKGSAWLSTENQTQKANTYLALGDLYFADNQFKPAGAYYDSCANVVPETHPEYEQITRQQGILGELIGNLRTIKEQDSLQNLAKMSVDEIEKEIEKLLASEAEAELKRQEREAKQKRREEILKETQKGSSIMDGPNSLANTGEWYFYNPVAIGRGATDFRRKWGNRVIEDNWRRSQKEITFESLDTSGFDSSDTSSVSDSSDTGIAEEELPDGFFEEIEKIDETKRKYFADIPFLPAQKRASSALIIEALYGNGLIYYEKLEDQQSAIQSFETLLNRFPDSKFEAACHYYLYKIYSELENVEKADYHKSIIETKHANSQYAQLMNGSIIDAEVNNDPMLERMYDLAYSQFKQGDCDALSETYLNADKTADQNYLRGKFEFLMTVCTGRSKSTDSLVIDLQNLIQKYPTGDVATESKNLIRYLVENKKRESSEGSTEESSEEIIEEKAFPFIKDKTGDFYFMMVVRDKKVKNEKIKSELSNYNSEYHRSDGFSVKSYLLGEDKLYIVKTFQAIEKVQKYHSGIQDDIQFLESLGISSLSMVYISTENFKLLIKDQNTSEYIEFFDWYFVTKEN